MLRTRFRLVPQAFQHLICWTAFAGATLSSVAPLQAEQPAPVEAMPPAGWRIHRAPVESKKPLPPVALLVERLSSPKFAERVQASRDLVRTGGPAVEALVEAARSDRPEASLRAVAALEDLWLKSLDADDSETTAAVFNALNDLSESDDLALQSRIEATLAAHESRVSKYSLDEIARLGGSVRYENGINIINDDGTMRPQVSLVLLDKKWDGGEDGLRHVRRVRPQVLYIIGNVQLPEGAAERFTAASNIKVERRGTAYLGIRNSSLVPLQGIGGVHVEVVEPETPAAKGGILPGDVITEFAGGEVRAFPELVEQIQKTEPGQTVKAKVIRQAERIDLDITMEAWTR
ncbi:MAG: PDZ domain-containing protein [Planctomycetota bacterium]|nr:PDZ domain-containing protein [Planctomycetota bacterium]